MVGFLQIESVEVGFIFSFVMLFAVNGCWFGWSEKGETSNFSKDQ